MSQQKRKNSTNSVEREYGFENRAEQRGAKSLFQLALELEDLVEKQKLRRSLTDVEIPTRYIK